MLFVYDVVFKQGFEQLIFNCFPSPKTYMFVRSILFMIGGL